MKQVLFVIILMIVTMDANASGVRLKDMARIEGRREVPVVGYGIVVGLAGTGDTSRNKATLQSLANTLEQFGLQVEEEDLSARNVAAVMVTGQLPPFSEPGDRLDLQVASTGDARSLVGGTLLLTALYGPDDELYALGQGSLSVGGYHVESFNSSIQKNHPTVGRIPDGGSVEQPPPSFEDNSDVLTIILDEPDYTTANRIVNRIQEMFGIEAVFALHPGKISIVLPSSIEVMPFIAALEKITVSPDINARLVINQRTGTIVAGGNVTLGEVSVAHGNLRIEIRTSYAVSQPQMLIRPGVGVETAIIPDTSITVVEEDIKPVELPAGTTVAELVQALYKIKVSTRDTISILEAIKAAGALHADLIIQ